ncbi:MAG: hypothetical protein JRN21_09720 [Nitrososphaerota archaeon]|nr:hypothetical protein [Nitrososphaerota archaeon]
MVNMGKSPSVKVRLISEDEVRLEGPNIGVFFEFNFNNSHETPAKIRYRNGGILIEMPRKVKGKTTPKTVKQQSIDSTIFLSLIGHVKEPGKP